MKTGRLRLTLCALLLLVAPACPSQDDDEPRPAPTPENAIFIHFLGASTQAERFVLAAQLAVEQVDSLGGRPLRLVTSTATDLTPVQSDPDVIGAITFGGRDAITAARDELDRSFFPVFELSDDLYEAGQISDSIFQMSTPHSWEAWRLARYFGPGDRGYRSVGLLRSTDPQGEIASIVLEDELSTRRVEFVDGGGDVSRLRDAGVDAVVVEGDPSLPLMDSGTRYAGKDRIHDGWRPQVAFFQPTMALELDVAPGTVAVGTYARASEEGDRIQAVREFREAFEARFQRAARGDEAIAYDAVRALAEGFVRAGGGGRSARIDAIEGFDRVRFGGLPLSFSPTDHVGPERDHLGLWAIPASADSWSMLHRTFTNDLERTNVLEEDWPAYFEGTTPGGEAPFYYTAKSGITSDKSDLLH